jgi:hypothetical protein
MSNYISIVTIKDLYKKVLVYLTSKGYISNLLCSEFINHKIVGFGIVFFNIHLFKEVMWQI